MYCTTISYVASQKVERKIENVIFDMNNIKDKNLIKLTIVGFYRQ